VKNIKGFIAITLLISTTFTATCMQKRIKKNIRQKITCHICKDDLESPSQNILIPPCKHKFHEKCINSLRKTGAICPICNKKIPQTWKTKPKSKQIEREITKTEKLLYLSFIPAIVAYSYLCTVWIK